MKLRLRLLGGKGTQNIEADVSGVAIENARNSLGTVLPDVAIADMNDEQFLDFAKAVVALTNKVSQGAKK